jgi:cytochrome o ubiquinol oxidase operon protein cyoD
MPTVNLEHKPSHLLGYLWGFFLALLLSVLAFGLVMVGSDAPFGGMELVLKNLTGKVVHLPQWLLVSGVLALAVLQLLVHLHYFLHLDASAGQRWNVLSLLFALLLIGIMAGGTLWILYNLNYLMMPGM